jgi:hypothetical protein
VHRDSSDRSHNPACQFISDNAQGATRKYGVKSVSIPAIKE